MTARTRKPRPRRWASIAEAAKYASASTKTIRRMIAVGDVPAHRVGGRLLRVDLNELDDVTRPVPAAERSQAVES